MDHLHRELAPIGEAAWKEIDREAARTLKRTLAARRLVDFSGPHGWQSSSLDLGRSVPIDCSVGEVRAELRQAQSLVEHRAPFTIARRELDAIERGARDPDLVSLVNAAQAAAHAEDKTVFEGSIDAGIRGLFELGASHALSLGKDYERYPQIVATALTWLRQQGVDGPYAIALGPRCFQGLTETANRGGYPVMNLVRQQLDGPFVWAPALEGALIMSTRGGDFELRVGQDFAIGYRRHDDTEVELYLEESFTFVGRTPEAVVPLRYEPAKPA